MSSIWDNPEFRTAGDYAKFEAVGDSIAGTVTAVRVRRWEDGTVSPEVLLVTDDGEEKAITVGQVRLKAALAEQRPEAGDHLTVTLTDIEKRGGGKTLKHWSVQVRRGTGAPPATSGASSAPPAAAAPAPAAAATPPAAAPDPAAIAAALSSLTPEQRQAVGLPG